MRGDPHAAIYPISSRRFRMVAEPCEKKTRIESRSERAIASGCNSANTFRFPLERARPPSRIIHVKFVQRHPRRVTPRAMCGQRCAFLRFAEPENDGREPPFFFTAGKRDDGTEDNLINATTGDNPVKDHRVRDESP